MLTGRTQMALENTMRPSVLLEVAEEFEHIQADLNFLGSDFVAATATVAKIKALDDFQCQLCLLPLHAQMRQDVFQDPLDLHVARDNEMKSVALSLLDGAAGQHFPYPIKRLSLALCNDETYVNRIPCFPVALSPVRP